MLRCRQTLQSDAVPLEAACGGRDVIDTPADSRFPRIVAGETNPNPMLLFPRLLRLATFHRSTQHERIGGRQQGLASRIHRTAQIVLRDTQSARDQVRPLKLLEIWRGPAENSRISAECLSISLDGTAAYCCATGVCNMHYLCVAAIVEAFIVPTAFIAPAAPAFRVYIILNRPTSSPTPGLSTIFNAPERTILEFSLLPFASLLVRC